MLRPPLFLFANNVGFASVNLFALTSDPKVKEAIHLNFMVEAPLLEAISGESQVTLVAQHIVGDLNPAMKHISPKLVFPYAHSHSHIDRHKAQGCWISPKLPKTNVPSPFKRDLLEYLAAYGSCLSFLVERVKQYDFSSCKGTLVASVPGRHTGAMHHRFGAMKVKQAIRRLEVTQLSPASSIILQCSSIGSWGTNNKWLKSIFGALDPHGLIPDHEFYFIYPTVENVRNSVEGWNAGNSLPYSHQCHLKHLSYLKQYLCSWHAIESGQKARMPHIKSYVQVNQATKEMDWIWLTSANMSKAAMGEEQKTGYFIRNYELGIFLAPSMFPDRPVFRYCTQKEDESYTQQWCFHPDHFDSENVYHRPLKEEGGVIVISDDETEPRKRQKQERLIMPIRLAYDLPVRKYSDQDECWTFDIPRTEPDLFGQQRL